MAVVHELDLMRGGVRAENLVRAEVEGVGRCARDVIGRDELSRGTTDECEAGRGEKPRHALSTELAAPPAPCSGGARQLSRPRCPLSALLSAFASLPAPRYPARLLPHDHIHWALWRRGWLTKESKFAVVLTCGGSSSKNSNGRGSAGNKNNGRRLGLLATKRAHGKAGVGRGSAGAGRG